MRASASTATAAVNSNTHAAAGDDFTPVVSSRHNRHHANNNAHSTTVTASAPTTQQQQHNKRNRIPAQDEHKQHRLSFDDKPPPSIAAHSPASSRRSSRASNPRASSYDELDEDGDWDSGLTYGEEKQSSERSGSGSGSRRQRVQSNADEYDGGGTEYDRDEYEESPPSSDSDTAAECPLCMEPLDPTDLAFRPCMCGYQVCLYCYNNILDNLNGQCPACRREYDRSLATTASLAQLTQPTLIQQAQQAQQVANERKDKKRLRELAKRKATQHDRHAVSQQQQAHLASVRIIQRNLVYICGLPPAAAYEDWLRKREAFGRFGKIVKGQSHTHTVVPSKQTQAVIAVTLVCAGTYQVLLLSCAVHRLSQRVLLSGREARTKPSTLLHPPLLPLPPVNAATYNSTPPT